MALLFRFIVPADEVVVDVSASLNEDNGQFKVALRLDQDQPREITLGPPGENGLLVPKLDFGVEFIGCLAACLVGVAVHHILECWDDDLEKFIRCLKSKGITIGEDAFKCVTRCVIGLGGL